MRYHERSAGLHDLTEATENLCVFSARIAVAIIDRDRF